MRWMCSRQAGGEGHLVSAVPSWRLSSGSLALWPRRCRSGSESALAALSSESSDTGQRSGFTRFHALRYGPKPTLGVASRPTGYARLCGALRSHRDGRGGGLLRSLLEHKVLQPSSWTAVPYGTLLAAQRLGDWEEVNSCAKAAAELTAGRCSS
jgi:hypothetical protein